MAEEEYDLDALTSMLNEGEEEDGVPDCGDVHPHAKGSNGDSKTPHDFEDDIDMDTLASMLGDVEENNDGKVTEPSATELGLDLSDEEAAQETAIQPSTKETKQSAFSAAFSGLQSKLPPEEISSSSTSVENIDPLEMELRKMEERMNKIKSELARKKNLDTSSSDSTKKFTKLTNPTQGPKETSRVLTSEEKSKLLQRLKKSSEVHGGDTDSEDEEDNRNPFETQYNSYGRSLRKTLEKNNDNRTSSALQESLTAKKEQVLNKLKAPEAAGWKETNGSLVAVKNGAMAARTPAQANALREPNSGIYIVNPLIDVAQMQERMVGRRHVPLTTIPLHTRGGEMEGDWFTIAVLVSKSQPKTSQKGSQYSVWQLSDLRDCTKTVGLFLFAGAHSDLWKTAVGAVVGVLNAQIMKDRQGEASSNLVTLSVNNGLKVMLMGSARDLSWCKGRTKAGGACKQFVNKFVCEFCVYHVQREYQKSASKRADIQSSFSRNGPKQSTLKQKVLGKDQVFYGGNMYSNNNSSGPDISSPVIPSKANPKLRAKDLATLSSLTLRAKGRALEAEEKKKTVVLKHLSEGEISVAKELVKDSEGLGSRLLAPTPGARNLLRHKAKEEESSKNRQKTDKGQALYLSAKDLLNMKHSQILSIKKQQADRLKSSNLASPKPSLPQLGRGLLPGQDIELEISPQPNKPFDPAKAKALAILKRKGETLKPAEKNVVRNKHKAVDPDYKEKIKKRLRETANENESDEENSSGTKKNRTEEFGGRSSLGSVDLNKEKIKEMIEKRSKHGNLLDAEEDIAMEKYYNKLEKKEMLEEQMTSVMEVPISAVVCNSCQYKAVVQSQFCKEQGHLVKSVKTVKRFFECGQCKRRTVSLDKRPTKACSNCQSTSWQRVAMAKARKGPLMENEVLCLRGNEQKNYSGVAEKVYLNID